jgi:hypothetical protein
MGVTSLRSRPKPWPSPLGALLRAERLAKYHKGSASFVPTSQGPVSSLYMPTSFRPEHHGGQPASRGHRVWAVYRTRDDSLLYTVRGWSEDGALRTLLGTISEPGPVEDPRSIYLKEVFE